MQYFWVNQDHFKEEQSLGVIIADTNESNHHGRMRIFDVRKGDVIFSFSERGFQAVLIAKEDANISDPRCVVACRYTVFDSPFDLKLVVDAVYKYVNYLYTPINREGNRCYGYLYPLNIDAAEVLLDICGLEFGDLSQSSTDDALTRRRKTTFDRIIRDTIKSRNIKRLYNHSCQVCGIQLSTYKGSYSEGAHIIPLGEPHNGPDQESNILCLCPNHHVLLDGYSFSISNKLMLIGLDEDFTVNDQHKISKESLAWHRKMYKKVNR